MVGMICPYCEKKARLEYGMFGSKYECVPCGASVGCHNGTHKPLGTLAKRDLRSLRVRVHLILDPLWQARGKQKGQKARMTRKAAYGLLRNRMDMTKEKCHIAMFDEDQCYRAINVLTEYERRRK